MYEFNSFTVFFVALMCWHYIADYPLQGDFLSRAKNKWAPIPGIFWHQAMLAHSVIQAMGVWLITGSTLLFFLELVIHFIIDVTKCAGKISFAQDQFLHMVCKLIWAAMIVWVFKDYLQMVKFPLLGV